MSKKIFLCLLISLIHFNVYSVPAYPYPIKYKQPDGSDITVQLKGDERVHWAETSDGYTLLSNGKNGWEYALSDANGELKTSGMLAREVGKRTVNELKMLKGVSKNIRFSSKQVNTLKSVWEAKYGSDKLIGTGDFFKKADNKSTLNDGRKKVFSPTGTKKLIMILIEYTDVKFTYKQEDFDKLMNTQNYNQNGAQGCVKDFFNEMSYGQFNVVTDVAPVIYTADHDMAYYGAPDGSKHDIRANDLMKEAIQKADPDVDYTQYDNDNDGSIDGVYIIYAGYGEASSGIDDTIWPHAGGVSGLTFDGKTASKYSCSNELNYNGVGKPATLTTIGVICHEFGHVCGAPDYYDTDYEIGGQFPGTGTWDLMTQGVYNGAVSGSKPAHFNPFEKIRAGWLTPVTLTTATSIANMPDITTTPVVYKYNTGIENEYYLLENRQQTGFNTYCPGHGLMIYHYSKTYWDAGRNKTAPQGFYPVCASATTFPTTSSNAGSYGSISSDGCPFPGTSVKTSFTDDTTPTAKSWNGSNTSKPLTNITETSGLISFVFINTPTVNPILTFTATGASSSQINLAWTNNYDGNNVIIARNSSSTFGTPVIGTTYSVGNEISGGGTVVYSGSASSFNDTGLSASTTYYYQIWATDGTNYSDPNAANGTTACNSISTPLYTEGFESTSIPACWEQNYVLKNYDWSIQTRGINSHPASAHSGSNLIRFNTLACDDPVTKLVLNPFDLSGNNNAALKFWHTQEAWNGSQDILKVYYKTSVNGNWNLLATYNSNITTWTQETINLPNTTATYYVAFEGIAKCGYGACIDDVEVWKDVNVTTNTWIGGESIDWFTTSNWSLGIIPSASLDVEIPSGTTFSPTIAATGATCKNITINNGATLTMGTSSTNDLTINGSITNNGTLTATNTNSTINIAGDWTNNGTFNYGTSTAGSKVNFNGTNSLQTINGISTTDFYILQVKKGSISNILEATALISLKATSSNLVLTAGTLKISSNSTITPLTSASSLSINSSSGIWNNGGTLNPTGKQCNLTGMFRSSAGTSNFSFLLPIGSANNVQIDGGLINITSYFEPFTTTTDIINYTQTGGNLNINSSNTNIPFLLTSGSKFIMSGGTISIQKKSGAAVEYQNLAGTSNVTGGTLQIGNASTTGSPVIRINSTTPIYNLTVNSIGTPTAQLVTNPLSVYGDVTIGSGAKIDANSLNLSVNGNWTNNGIGLSASPTGTVTFNGTASQSIAGNATIFNNLTLNNSNGLALNGTDATVNGVLSFTSGVITTGNNKLIIPTTGSVARTSGHINGFLQKGFETGTNIAKTLEIGDVLETAYKPVDISFNNITNSGYLIGSTTSSDFPQISLSNLNATKSINRYWEVTNSGIAFDNYGATFNFSLDDLDAALDFSKIYAGKYNSTTSEWVYPTISNKTATSITVNGLTSFSNFIFAEKNIGTDIKESQNIDFTLSVNANKQIEIALSKYDSNTKVVICNLMGQVIFSKLINAQKTTVDTKLHTGVYLVSIVTLQKSVCKTITIK